MAAHEEERAIMESECAAAEEEYFAARPQIDCTDRRRVFEAGFQRAWDRAFAYHMENGQDA